MAILNPKAYGAMAALFSGFVFLPEQPILGGALKTAVLFSWALTVNMTWMISGVALARLMRHPKHSRMLNIFFALLLILSVVLLFLPFGSQI